MTMQTKRRRYPNRSAAGISKYHRRKRYSEQECLQALNELKFYETNGRYSCSVTEGAKLGRRIIRISLHSKELYERRKQALIDRIITYIRIKGEKREA